MEMALNFMEKFWRFIGKKFVASVHHKVTMHKNIWRLYVFLLNAVMSIIKSVLVIMTQLSSKPYIWKLQTSTNFIIMGFSVPWYVQ